MNSSLLRIDWYSFVVGTQISTVIGILTTSSYLGIRIRFAREYLYPTLSNNGNTLFLFRIKEPGNWLRNGIKLLSKIFEKNIVAGVLYTVIEKYIATLTSESIVKAFACGGIVGLCSCFSYKYYDLQDTNFMEILLCWFASAEISALFQEVKLFTILMNQPNVNFGITIPFQPLSFWNGGIVGSLVGIRYGDFLNVLDDLVLPEIENEDFTWVMFAEYFSFYRDLFFCVFKFVLNVIERFAAGGIVHCLIEYLIQNVTGLQHSLLTPITTGCLHGLYLGIESGQFKRVMGLSWIVTSFLLIIPWIGSDL